ncbi:Piwi domain [Trypanosoma vivax]|nr:Piwi domain [Trypanosoma vivax]
MQINDWKEGIHSPEVLCEMSVGEQERRALPQLCSIYPQDRAARIRNAIQRLKNENNGEAMRILKAYGLTLVGEPCKVTGCVLKPVSILIPRGQGFKTVKTEGAGGQQGFIRDLKELRHAAQEALSKAIVYDETRRGELVTNQISRYLEGMGSPLLMKNVSHINNMRDVGKYLNEEAFALAFLHRHDKDTYRRIKTAWTNKGILSQVVVKDLGERDAPIVMAISQQMTAKCGHFNWVVNLNDMCPKLGAKIGKAGGLLIIGADVGRDQRLLRNEGATALQDMYTVAFVAFHVSGFKWHTYCDHYQVNGRKCTVYSAAEDEGSSKSDAGTTPSDVLSAKMGEFLQEATRHFEDKGLRVSSVLVMRGCASEGELFDAQRNDCDVLEGFLRGNASWAVVAAQRFQHTRFAAKAPQDEEALCNVQRGFVCEECTDSKFEKAFYLTSAHCTLGHARATLYVVFKCENFELRELQSLIYGMCFMFPNKADALPLPLPLKCASEYGKKFVVLPEVRNLHKKLRDTMHYL